MLKRDGTSSGKRRSTCGTLQEISWYRLHSEDYSHTVSDFYSALDTPVSLACHMLFKYGEFEQLVRKEVDPRQYNDANRFADDFAAISFCRKNSSLRTGIDTKEVALLAFAEAEAKCRVTNYRLPRSLSLGLLNPDDWYVISSQISKIGNLLGDFSIDEMLDKCGWGPGSTLKIRGFDTSASHKFDSESDITQGAYNLFGEVLSKAYNPLWGKVNEVSIVKGNSIVTVPKNAKTDRTIAIEPGLNLWVQLGIGRMIRRRLRFAGFNLDSDLKNKRGAFLGSVGIPLSTIDFKAASDTISRSLVELLLPKTWYMVLDSARSQVYTLNGKNHVSEKFSTMGNGFTFELESLIFVTLAMAICQKQGVSTDNVSIFGDDLIIPTCCVEQLTRLCELYGFTVNTQKSFSDGYFRESCGSYYWNGQDVKPLFLKLRPQSLKDVYRLANSIRLFAHNRCTNIGCDLRFRSMWSRLIARVPKNLMFKGPLLAGDAVISVNLSESKAQRPSNGWEGFSFPAIPTVSVQIEKDSPGLLLARLYSPSRDQAYNNLISLRAKSKIILKRKMFAAQWYDYGPWISRL